MADPNVQAVYGRLMGLVEPPPGSGQPRLYDNGRLNGEVLDRAVTEIRSMADAGNPVARRLLNDQLGRAHSMAVSSPGQAFGIIADLAKDGEVIGATAIALDSPSGASVRCPVAAPLPSTLSIARARPKGPAGCGGP
jgi:hypothetical protein